MNTKWIRSFITVAEEGSVTSAANKLFISPQALLQQINLLEQEVGEKLFVRQRTGMSLTLAGQEFLSGARQAEELYANILTRCRLASKAEETIRIPMMSNIILPEFMESVCSEYGRRIPDPLKIEFITDSVFEERMNGLVDLRYDIIEHYAVDGQCPKGIHFEYLSDVPTWCIMSPYHELASKSRLIPEDLDGCHIVSPASNIKLSGYLHIYIAGAGIKVTEEASENDRYKIIDSLNNGGIYLADAEIAKIFVGFHSVPLDFDNHVQHGLACREEMYERYKPFFEIAHERIDQQAASHPS